MPETNEEHNTDKQPRPRAWLSALTLGHVRALLVWLTLLLVGSWLGMIIAMLIMGGDLNALIIRFAPGAIAGLIVLALFSTAARWVVFPNAKKKLKAFVVALLDRDRTFQEKGNDPELRVDAVEVVSVYFAGRTFFAMAILVGGIVGSLLLAGQLLTMLEQNKKLDKQNTLFTTQNIQITQQSEAMRDQNAIALYQTRVDALARRTEFEEQAARLAYERIVSKLDPSLSIPEQLAALQRIPEVMTMPVTRLDDTVKPAKRPDINDELPVVIEYPNLQELGEKLLIFARAPRSAEDEEIGKLSTAICTLLTVLSTPPEPEQADNTSLWWLIFGEFTRNDLSAVPAMTMRQAVEHARSLSKEEVPIDLSGMGRTQLKGFNLPHVVFDGANLSGTRWESARLDGAYFWEAEVENVSFANSSLIGASFNWTTLDDCWFFKSDLRYCDAWRSEFIGGTISVCSFAGAHFTFVTFDETEMIAIDLRAASLYKTDLSTLTFEGVDLRGTLLRECKVVNPNEPSERLTLELPSSQLRYIPDDGSMPSRFPTDNDPTDEDRRSYWLQLGSVTGVDLDQLSESELARLRGMVFEDGLDPFSENPADSNGNPFPTTTFRTRTLTEGIFDHFRIEYLNVEPAEVEKIKRYLAKNIFVLEDDNTNAAEARPFDPSNILIE